MRLNLSAMLTVQTSAPRDMSLRSRRAAAAPAPSSPPETLFLVHDFLSGQPRDMFKYDRGAAETELAAGLCFMPEYRAGTPAADPPVVATHEQFLTNLGILTCEVLTSAQLERLAALGAYLGGGILVYASTCATRERRRRSADQFGNFDADVFVTGRAGEPKKEVERITEIIEIIADGHTHCVFWHTRNSVTIEITPDVVVGSVAERTSVRIQVILLDNNESMADVVKAFDVPGCALAFVPRPGALDGDGGPAMVLVGTEAAAHALKTRTTLIDVRKMAFP